MLLLDDDDVLPVKPSADEVRFTVAIGADGIDSVERAILGCTRGQWLKVARVVHDALTLNGFPASDEVIAMHARTVGALVNRGALEAQGELRKPRWSEIRLPVGTGKSPLPER